MALNVGDRLAWRPARLPTLDRYFAVIVAQSFGIALVTLLAIFTVINATEELQRVGPSEYSARQALWYILLTVPAEAYALFPAAAVLGAAIGLGGLAHRNEIIALATAGVSRMRIVWSALRIALALIVVGVLLSELVGAPLSYRARTERAIALSGGRILSEAGGVWARAGPSFVNLRTVLPDGAARDIYLYEFDAERRMRRFGYAQTATYSDHHWLLEGLVETTIADDGVRTERVASRPLAIDLTPRQLGLLHIPPAELSLSDLHRRIAAARRQGDSAERLELAWWQRATMPIVIAVMSFVAVSLILSMPRSTTLGRRIFAGALLGIGFQMLNETFASFGQVYGVPAWLSATLPTLLALAIGAWSLARSPL
jgi:lipopolysaccharide export system permease protein